MKAVNVIISVVLIGMCAIGWITFVTQTTGEKERYEKYVEQGDDWVKDGLYQRAIEQYLLALEEKPSEELYEKILDTYILRYNEAQQQTYEEYKKFLDQAVNAFPANKEFVETYVSVAKGEGEYEEVYECLLRAIDNGLDNNKIRSMLRETQYAYKIQRGNYDLIQYSIEGYYSVERETGWNLLLGGQSDWLYDDAEYVGLANKEGTTVVIDTDARLIHGNGTVLGIFKDEITSAGMFADGLVPACCEGKYNYYDEFAVKKFGGYEMASTFQNGKAAVKKDGKWMLIDTSGAVVSENYMEIVLDEAGQYLVDGTILVLEKKGEYTLYNEEWEKIGKIKADDVDILTEDGWIAFCKEGKWGFADKEGKTQIKPEYENAKSFSNGVAAVYKNGRWGFIDVDKNVVIAHQFLNVGYMDDLGKCPVVVDDGKEHATEVWQFMQLILGIKEK